MMMKLEEIAKRRRERENTHLLEIKVIQNFY